MFGEQVFEYGGVRLIKRTDTTVYHMQWYSKARRRTIRKSTGERDLERAKSKLIKHVDQRTPGSAKSLDEVSLAEIFADYAEAASNQVNARGALHSLRMLLEFADSAGIEFIGQFTAEAQNEYIKARRESVRRRYGRVSNATPRQDLGFFKSAVRHAWKQGRITEVPYVVSVPPPPPRQRFLNETEIQQLLRECKVWRLELYVRLALNTLQRPQAILDLQVDRVDLERGRLDFMAPWMEQSNKRRPVVPMTDGIRPYLERAIAESTSGFIVEHEGKPFIQHALRFQFMRARVRAGLGKDVTLYTLRHTGATLLAAKGVPMRQIAGMMGHTNTRTTEQHYAKHQPEFLSAAADGLDQILSTTG